MNDTIKTTDNEDILAGSLSGFDIAEQTDAGVPKNTAMFCFACALCLYACEYEGEPYVYLFDDTVVGALNNDRITAYNCMHGANHYVNALRRALPLEGLTFARKVEIITEYILLHSFNLYELPEPADTDEEEYQRQRNNYIIDDILKYVQWTVEECLGDENTGYISDERLLIALCYLNRITCENSYSARAYMYECGGTVAYGDDFNNDLNHAFDLISWLRSGNDNSQINFISDLLLIYYIAHCVRCYNEGVRFCGFPNEDSGNDFNRDDLSTFINGSEEDETEDGDEDCTDLDECFDFDDDDEDDDSIFDEVFDFSEFD